MLAEDLVALPIEAKLKISITEELRSQLAIPIITDKFSDM